MSEEITRQLIGRLSQLVALDTRSSSDNSTIISLLQQWFASYASYTQDWVREDGVKGKNLIVKIPGENHEQSLVFVCHMDTVPPSSAWETDPFILEEQEGKLYGLGACDTKGGVAALIQAILTLPQAPTVDTYLLFSGDEESTWTGVKIFKKHIRLPNPLFVAIEPTDNKLCVGARSILECTLTCLGVATHASFGTPDLNEKTSANYKMVHVLSALIDDAKQLATEYDPLLGSNSQNIGMIQGGTARNVLPDTCTASLDRRLLPKKDLSQEIQRLKSLVSSIDPQVAMTNLFYQDGFYTQENNKQVQQVLACAQKFLPQFEIGCFQAMSEVTIFQDQGACLVLGPGSIALAHKANEYVEAKELFTFVTIFQQILQQVSW